MGFNKRKAWSCSHTTANMESISLQRMSLDSRRKHEENKQTPHPQGGGRIPIFSIESEQERDLKRKHLYLQLYATVCLAINSQTNKNGLGTFTNLSSLNMNTGGISGPESRVASSRDLAIYLTAEKPVSLAHR